MHIQVNDDMGSSYSLPLNAITLRKFTYHDENSVLEPSETRWYILVGKGYIEDVVTELEVNETEYERIKNSIKECNALEAHEINLKAGKVVLPPQFVNAIMGLEV